MLRRKYERLNRAHQGGLTDLINKGDTFEISCHDPGGLCGFFYHDVFPNLLAFQFGGNLPWWEGDTIELQCPDPYNLVTMKLERSKRT